MSDFSEVLSGGRACYASGMSSSDSQPPVQPQQPTPQPTPPQHQPHPHQAQPQQPFGQPQSPQHPQPQYAPYAAPGLASAHDPTVRTNVLGLVALALLALDTLFAAFTPFLYRTATDNFAAVSASITVVHLLLLLAALGLAIAGVIQRGADRFRWAAVGSLVAGGFGLVGMLLNLFTGWVSSFMYW